MAQKFRHIKTGYKSITFPHLHTHTHSHTHTPTHTPCTIYSQKRHFNRWTWEGEEKTQKQGFKDVDNYAKANLPLTAERKRQLERQTKRRLHKHHSTPKTSKLTSKESEQKQEMLCDPTEEKGKQQACAQKLTSQIIGHA
jgi:hypothetical protein